jgi:predicted acylesterase/phospholipase RssA
VPNSGAQVTNLSSASGGSLIASYVALGGDRSNFLTIFNRNGLNLHREMTNFQDAVRLPFPGSVPFLNVRVLPGYEFSRTDAQAELIERELTGPKSLSDTGRTQPELMICATDLITGEGIGVTQEGLLMYPPISAEQKHAYVNVQPKNDGSNFLRSAVITFKDDPTIARFVAGSGAFPIAFPPVRVVFTNNETKKSRTLVLADGGLVDNLALNLMLAMHERASAKQDESRSMDFIIASDAGTETNRANLNPDRLLDAAGSALDIIYANVGMARAGSNSPISNPPIWLIKPGLLRIDSQCNEKIPDPSALEEFIGRLENLSFTNLNQTEVEEKSDERTHTMAAALCTFQATGTLQNRLSRKQAQILFDLGRCMILREWPQLYTCLSNLKASKQPVSLNQ